MIQDTTKYDIAMMERCRLAGPGYVLYIATDVPTSIWQLHSRGAGLVQPREISMTAVTSVSY